jgi:hypothetical protein
MRRLPLIFLCLSLACSDSGKGTPPSQKQEAGTITGQESWGSTIVLSQKGTIRMQLLAGHIRETGKDSFAIDGGVTADFFHETGRHLSRLTADSAEVVEGKRTRVWGSVALLSDDGAKLETTELIWDDRQGKITTEREIILSTKDGIERGSDFESTPDLKRWSMKQVTGKSLRDLQKGR